MTIMKQWKLTKNKKNSERPVDALAVKTLMTHLRTTWNQEMIAHLKSWFSFEYKLISLKWIEEEKEIAWRPTAPKMEAAASPFLKRCSCQSFTTVSASFALAMSFLIILSPNIYGSGCELLVAHLSPEFQAGLPMVTSPRISCRPRVGLLWQSINWSW